jgi:Domain of unknown function (DUF4232)
LRAIEGAMGRRYAELWLTNRSARPCIVYGYGGIQLVDAARRPVPTIQVRIPTPAPRRVLLRPGQSARSQLSWPAFAYPDENQTGPCQPTPAYLLVIPPDETESIAVTWPEGPVCNHGRIGQTAYAAV